MIRARLHEIIQNAGHSRLSAEELLRAALIFLDEIPALALTRADRVMAAVIRYYLK